MSMIHPTHQCFDDAIEQMGRLADAQPTLVHALCLGDGDVPYAHAWVEAGGYVWDAGVLDGQRIAYSVPALDYGFAKRVRRSWRYSLIEMLRENRRHGTYGPWVPELLALCGSSRRVLGKIDARYAPEGR